MSALTHQVDISDDVYADSMRGEPQNGETGAESPSSVAEAPSIAQLVAVHQANGRRLDRYREDDGTYNQFALRRLDFFGSDQDSDMAPYVPHDEATRMQLSMYLRAVGKLPDIRTAGEASKIASLDNVNNWHKALERTQNFFLVPLDHIETLESNLTAIHAGARNRGPSPWHWAARQAMGLKGTSGEGSLELFRFRIVFLPRTKRPGQELDRSFFNAFASIRTNITTVEEDTDVVHKLQARTTQWPLEYDPPLPTVRLPLSPIKAAAAFCMAIAADNAFSKLSPELQEWYDEANYFLRLVETESPCSFRKFDRPTSLRPLPPPPPGSCQLRRVVYPDLERRGPANAASHEPTTSSERTRERSAAEDGGNSDAREDSKSDAPSLVSDDDGASAKSFGQDTPALRSSGLDIPILYDQVDDAQFAALEVVRRAILDDVEAAVGSSDDNAAVLHLLRSGPAFREKELREVLAARAQRLSREAWQRIDDENEALWDHHLPK